MITVQLKGGHSNQMFQYAVARSLALKNNTTPVMDVSWFDTAKDIDAPRQYELGGYHIVENFYKPHLLEKLKLKTGYTKHYVEPQFNFDKNVLQLGKHVYLEGYFQTEKYFKDIRSTLLQDFTYKNPPSKANQQVLDDIQADPAAVSVHIRRGDYVTSKDANSFHGLKDIKYYESALKTIKKQVKKPHLYVISNDPAWCKQYLKLDAPMYVVDNNDDVTGGAEDMRLMRSCKHNIMANSSFSWWGAWLNENPNKIVIGPKKWFEDPSVDTTDLLPKEWITL